MGVERRQAFVFRRYLWLYEVLSSYGPVGYEEIAELWSRSGLNDDHSPLPHKTFENHRRAVETLFDIVVTCNRVTNQYYIAEEVDFQSREVRKLLDNALFLNNLASKDMLRRNISLEPVRNDVRYQRIVIEAIEEGKDLLLTYRHNYDELREETLHVKPIGLKLFRQRWYLVAEKPDGEPYSYPFDRVRHLSVGEVTAPTAYDIDSLFADTYGIIRQSDVKPEKVTMKVEREEANYLEALPLHASQQVVERADDYTIFSLTVCPTYDFIMEILSHGHKIEILSPPSLRSEINDRIKMAYRLYE